MLKLPSFQLHFPESLPEAIEMVARYGADAKIIAGGTDLLPSMKQELFTPKHLISLRRIPALTSIAPHADGGLRIGAMVTLRALQASAALRADYPALVHAARQVATIILQGMGTIGGNILLDTRCVYYNQSRFWRDAIGRCMKKDGDFCQVAKSSPRCLAAFSADTVPPLMLYGASVILEGREGAREVPLDAFYRPDGMAWVDIRPGEILTHVLLPPPEHGWSCLYHKVRIRRTIDYPLVGIGAGIRRGDDGTVSDARVILNAVESMPLVVEASPLRGPYPLDEARIGAVVDAAYQKVKPLTTHGVPPIYRKKMVRVALRRALFSLGEASSSLSV